MFIVTCAFAMCIYYVLDSLCVYLFIVRKCLSVIKCGSKNFIYSTHMSAPP